MRRALIGILMAATVATPVAAQDGNWRNRYERQAERNAERSERQEQRSEARQERFERQPVQVQPQQVQVRQQGDYRSRSEGRRGGWGGNWQGGERSAERAEMQRRIEASREAARNSVENAPSNYREQAQRNQHRYEQQVREQYRDRRDGDWRRGERNDRGNWGNDRGNRGGWSYGDRNDRRGGWNRGWRNDSRYDWQRYRSANRNLYRFGRYYAPYRNYNYSRLSIGLFLDQLFYSRNYWLSDPWQYRLPPAPYGTQWVRYYDDVVLVDVYSGEVLDVIYDFFW